MALTIQDRNVIETATHKAFYENIFPKLKHIDGKGVAESFLATDDPTKCNEISIPRVLPIKPNYRRLGAINGSNAGWLNKNNYNGGSIIESAYFNVALDYIFDENTELPYTLVTSNDLVFKNAVNSVITDCFAGTLNTITWANQIMKSIEDMSDVSEFYVYDGTKVTASQAFLDANSDLSNGDLSIGAKSIPYDKRQAFISTNMNKAIKSQYSTNASDLAVMINATGFVNPYTQAESKRVDMSTGLCGLYDGVIMTLWTTSELEDVYVCLGATTKGKETALAALKKVQGMIVYGDATIRGVAGVAVEVGEDPSQYKTLVFKPYAKFGVKALSGKSNKLIASGTISSDELTALKTLAVADELVSGGDGVNYSIRRGEGK